jgi:hypothetical protein
MSEPTTNVTVKPANGLLLLSDVVSVALNFNDK